MAEHLSQAGITVGAGANDLRSQVMVTLPEKTNTEISIVSCALPTHLPLSNSRSSRYSLE